MHVQTMPLTNHYSMCSKQRISLFVYLQAAKYGHCAHIDLLIRYGADINAQNLVGNTPLHVAASHGQVK